MNVWNGTLLGLAALWAGAVASPEGEATMSERVVRSSWHAASAVADTARARLAVRGMTCGSCALTARLALERAPGVYRAEVSYDSASAVVLYDPERTSPDRFIARLEKLTGFTARAVAEPSPLEEGEVEP